MSREERDPDDCLRVERCDWLTSPHRPSVYPMAAGGRQRCPLRQTSRTPLLVSWVAACGFASAVRCRRSSRTPARRRTREDETRLTSCCLRVAYKSTSLRVEWLAGAEERHTSAREAQLERVARLPASARRRHGSQLRTGQDRSEVEDEDASAGDVLVGSDTNLEASR